MTMEEFEQVYKIMKDRDAELGRAIVAENLREIDKMYVGDQCAVKTQAKANTRQVAGDHYKSKIIQPWDAMEAWLPPEQFRGFLLGTSVKYLARAGDKGDFKEDIEKAHHYLEKLLETLQTQEPTCL